MPNEKAFRDTFYSTAELAARFGRSPRTLRRWANQDYGPPRIMIGRSGYYSVEGVRHWVYHNTVRRPDMFTRWPFV